MLAFAGVPALSLALYVLVNQVWFGIWLPVSGYVKRALLPTGPSPASVAAFAVFAAALCSATWLALGRRWPDPGARRAIALSVLTLYLLLYQAEAWLNRGVLVPEIWYLGPHVLWAFCVLSILLARVRRRGLLAAAMVGALAAAGLSWSIRLQRSSYALYVAAHDVARWIDEHLPPDAIVAGWDVGILGYYSGRRVVNLDGLANSWRYVGYLERGAGLDFLDECGVQYIAQYHSRELDFRPLGYDLDALRARTEVVVHAQPVRFAAWSMLFSTGRRRAQEYVYEVRAYRR
jgi:hypothetical protein